MSEKSSWGYEYGVEITTPDQGTRMHWDDGQYPKSRNDMELRVLALREEFKRAGSGSVSRARLFRRKRWTKVITTYEPAEVQEIR